LIALDSKKDELEDTWKAFALDGYKPMSGFVDRAWLAADGDQPVPCLTPQRQLTIAAVLTDLLLGRQQDVGTDTLLFKDKSEGGVPQDYDTLAKQGHLSTHSYNFENWEPARGEGDKAADGGSDLELHRVKQPLELKLHIRGTLVPSRTPCLTFELTAGRALHVNGTASM